MRDAYRDAASVFVDLTATITGEWTRPALGTWDVRTLVGHMTRSFTTLLDYVDLDSIETSPNLGGPVAYYASAAVVMKADPAGVDERARVTAVGLGDDPLSVVGDLAARACDLVGCAPDDASVTTPWGTMTLAAYLPTRVFELAVHGLDLCDALGRPVPDALQPAVTEAVDLASQMAVAHGDGAQVLRVLTGRADLSGFSVV